jgi:hypothetical protein
MTASPAPSQAPRPNLLCSFGSGAEASLRARRASAPDKTQSSTAKPNSRLLSRRSERVRRTSTLLCVAHPADSRNLKVVSRPPTRSSIVRVRDVLLIPSTGTGTESDRAEHPPAGTPGVALSKYTRLERLPPDLCRLIRSSCLPRGHFFIPAQQEGFLYAYVFDIPEHGWEQNRYGWDPAGDLVSVLGFSRLIVDNAHTTQYACRVVEYRDGSLQVIPFSGPADASIAFRPHPDRRDWLDAAEAAELADLLGKVLAGGTVRLPARVARAMWMQESSVRLRYADLALPVLVTGLEALINTSDASTTKQFTHRVSALASELRVDGVSKTRCSRVYLTRSQSVHGGPIDLLDSKPRGRVFEDMAKMQTVLRRTIRAAADQPQFRAAFGSAEAVRARWPVEVDGEFV